MSPVCSVNDLPGSYPVTRRVVVQTDRTHYGRSYIFAEADARIAAGPGPRAAFDRAWPLDVQRRGDHGPHPARSRNRSP